MNDSGAEMRSNREKRKELKRKVSGRGVVVVVKKMEAEYNTFDRSG